VDRFGSHTILKILSGLVFLGQLLFTMGVSLKSFPLMLMGRFCFGVGAESLEITQMRITTEVQTYALCHNNQLSLTKFNQMQWFTDIEFVGFVLAFNVSTSRIATGLSNVLSPWIAASLSVSDASWFGCLVCLMSFSACLAMIYIDSPETRRKHQIKLGLMKDETSSHNTTTTLSFLHLDTSFYILCLFCMCSYGATIPFLHISPGFFSFKWGLDERKSGFVMSIPNWIGALTCPIFGSLFDQSSRRGHILLFSSSLLFSAHCLLLLSRSSPMYLPYPTFSFHFL
jgi:nitrate/nitrite transporter NarK